MPWGLHRHQQCHHLHFITFSCYRRRKLLDPLTRRLFERALDRARVKYGFFVVGYVVMPEHVHLLVSEPERDLLATAVQAIKQSVARRRGGRFWQERYYDFNVFSERKRVEKLRYMHRNPVKRGLGSARSCSTPTPRGCSLRSCSRAVHSDSISTTPFSPVRESCRA